MSWASSRMRCYWPAKWMRETDVQSMGSPISQDYDAYIFQKFADPIINRRLLDAGKQVWWDVCDPMWWFSPKESRAISETVTGVVASSEALARDYEAWANKPCHVIPDRLYMSHFPRQAVHQDTDCVKMIWFGLSANRYSLLNALDNLNRLEANGYKYELTILDNQPEISSFSSNLPIHQERWALDTENEMLASHDIALLPPYPGPWGKVKSNNKKLTAWASGLAVTEGTDYAELLELATNTTARRNNAHAGAMNIQLGHYTADYSARDWEALLNPQVEVMYIGRR